VRLSWPARAPDPFQTSSWLRNTTIASHLIASSPARRCRHASKTSAAHCHDIPSNLASAKRSEGEKTSIRLPGRGCFGPSAASNAALCSP
jgi:hypothetical protein